MAFRFLEFFAATIRNARAPRLQAQEHSSAWIGCVLVSVND
jgi:hypothetical protein